MSEQKIMFSPVTRLSGLLSVEVIVDQDRVVEANASGTMFRGYEWIMRNHHVTDAVYLTQRICGICSLAHGAMASYLLDELYANELSENAQYLRNVMYGADFLQNHIRHFYLFSLPDFVSLPDSPPYHGQNLADARLGTIDNQRLAGNSFEAIKAAQRSHEILALFGGKAPHQHSFLHGGVAVAPTADKINRALALLDSIQAFVKSSLMPDTELIARVYGDYFKIGVTPRRLLSFGLFKFGPHNEQLLWRSGVLTDGRLTIPRLELIKEGISSSWYTGQAGPGTNEQEAEPDPQKPGAYTWIKSARYAGQYYETGPLARMIINGFYNGGTSTMDRIYARSLETLLIADLMKEWLLKLQPGPAPLKQNAEPVKSEVIVTTDAMRGALLHSARIVNEQVERYNIITPTVWNFSPKDQYGQRGPVESALVDTSIPRPDMLFTLLGRIVRSYDPCISCATHVLDAGGNVRDRIVL